ncbi:hypothetical protein [Haloferax sp. KTX1]|uniref:hypothetical protein n=1 Tax=Haloferax sp. KTX1 TaxID=2600597 RepID=UPI0011DD4683|nr:hypothetical protein [Haloferax sp. KTX1]
MSVPRRTLLHYCGLATIVGLAGCAGFGTSSAGAPDLVLVNQNDAPITVETTVTDATGETLVSTRLDVPVVEGHGRPNASIDNVFDTDGTYAVSVAVTDGPSATTELDVDGTAEDTDTHQVYFEGDEITFS